MPASESGRPGVLLLAAISLQAMAAADPLTDTRDLVSTLQVTAPTVVLYAEPTKESLAVVEVGRGRELPVLEVRGDWLQVSFGSGIGATAWVRREPAEYGGRTVELFDARGLPLYAGEMTGALAAPSAAAAPMRPGNRPNPVVTLPAIDPRQLPPPSPHLPRESIPIPDRWRVMQALDFKFPWYDPYHQNVLKGDIPITSLGNDVFLNVIGVSDTLAEFRRIPNPVSQTLSRTAGANDIYGDGEQQIYATTVLAGFSLLKGDTTFRPPDYEFRVLVAANYNHVRANEGGVLRANPLDCGGAKRSRLASVDRSVLPASPTGAEADEQDTQSETIDFESGPSQVLPGLAGVGSGPGGSGGAVTLSRVRLDNGGECSRSDTFAGLQELFLDYHLRNVSDRYDFDSIRVGIQPFTSDFRGFLFIDQPLGVRLFGNRHNNLWQYNLGAFVRLEKDTNSGFNDVTLRPRKDYVVTGNVFRQDFPILGFTSQLSWTLNLNREDADHYDTNDFLVRPALIGDARAHEYTVNYLGYSGDGHLLRLWPWARLNLSTSTYLAFGHDEHNPIAGRAQDILAFFHASELSRDFDWIRIRANVLFASGDDDPFDGNASGFDAIFEAPQFAGADTAYFIRQGIPLIGGGGVALSGRNGILPSLRSSREQGQSNFVNPGLSLLGLGADFDVLPQLRVTSNLSWLHFMDTDVLATLRQERKPDSEIGVDLAMGVQYRPFFNQNLVINASGSLLVTGEGLDNFYGKDQDVLYSTFVNVILTY